jgi:hypothetical protein
LKSIGTHQQERRDGAASCRRSELRLEAAHEETSIRQIGERVVSGFVLEPPDLQGPGALSAPEDQQDDDPGKQEDGDRTDDSLRQRPVGCGVEAIVDDLGGTREIVEVRRRPLLDGPCHSDLVHLECSELLVRCEVEPFERSADIGSSVMAVQDLDVCADIRFEDMPRPPRVRAWAPRRRTPSIRARSVCTRRPERVGPAD